MADLDEVAFAQDGCPDLAELWRRAGIAHAAIVRGWLEAGTDVVLAHGPFAEAGSYPTLLGLDGDGCRVGHVVLTVSVEAAVARVAADPGRPVGAMSRDPAFVRETHVAFAGLDLPPADATFDTTVLGAAAIADEVALQLRRASD